MFVCFCIMVSCLAGVINDDGENSMLAKVLGLCYYKAYLKEQLLAA